MAFVFRWSGRKCWRDPSFECERARRSSGRRMSSTRKKSGRSKNCNGNEEDVEKVLVENR